MTAGQPPAHRPPGGPVPRAERGEHWWPVALAIAAVAGLHVILPARYRVQPGWVVPAAAGSIALAALVIARAINILR